MSASPVVMKISCVLFGILLCLSICHAQSLDAPDVVKTIDLRGQDPWSAMHKSVKDSNEDVIVILIQGDDEILIKEIEGTLKALIHAKYNRIGLVLSDRISPESNDAIYIFAKGTLYAKIEEPASNTRTEWKVYNLVKEAYEDHIFSKMK